MPKMTTREIGNIFVLMLNSVGHYVHLETSDGSIREGKLTGYNCRTFTLNGKTVEYPTELELNGDPNDVVSLEMIAKLDID